MFNKRLIGGETKGLEYLKKYGNLKVRNLHSGILKTVMLKALSFFAVKLLSDIYNKIYFNVTKMEKIRCFIIPFCDS